MAEAGEAVDTSKLWDFREPAETRARFEALRLEASTQIARTYGLEGDFDKAHAVLDEVEKRLEKAPDRVKVRYLLERGRTFNSSGKKGSANKLFEQAFELARDIQEHGYAVDALHMLGYAATHDAKVKLGWEEKAVAYAEKCKDERALKWLGTLYNNMTWSYHGLEQYEKALAAAHKSEAWQAERSKGSRGHLIARWCVGAMLRWNERYEEALKVQHALAALYEERGEKDGFVQEELGEIYLAQGDGDKARPHFARAYAILKDTWVRDEKERLARLKKLGGG